MKKLAGKIVKLTESGKTTIVMISDTVGLKQHCVYIKRMPDHELNGVLVFEGMKIIDWKDAVTKAGDVITLKTLEAI